MQPTLHAYLRPSATAADLADRGPGDAVLVPPVLVAAAVKLGLRVSVAVGFPMGFSKPTIKAIEATSSLKDGATETFLTAHWPNLWAGDELAVKAELMEIARAARATRRETLIHVWLDAAVRFEPACRAIRQSGCDGVIAPADAITAILPHAQGLILTSQGLSPHASRVLLSRM